MFLYSFFFIFSLYFSAIYFSLLFSSEQHILVDIEIPGVGLSGFLRALMCTVPDLFLWTFYHKFISEKYIWKSSLRALLCVLFSPDFYEFYNIDLYYCQCLGHINNMEHCIVSAPICTSFARFLYCKLISSLSFPISKIGAHHFFEKELCPLEILIDIWKTSYLALTGL